MRQFIEDRARFGFVRAVNHIDAHGLAFGQCTNHFSQRRQDAIKRIRETDSFPSRPGEQSSGMRFPFRRHAVPERGRSFQKCSH